MKNFIKKYLTKENVTTLMGLTMTIIQFIGVVNVPENFIVIYNVLAFALVTMGFDSEQVKQIVKVKK